MKTLDTLSKRILVIAVSLSLLLLSLSAFLLTIQRVNAEPNFSPIQSYPGYVGLGLDMGNRRAYYGLINGHGGITIFSSPLPQ